MNANLLHLIWLTLAFLVLFGIAEVLYHKLQISVEYTRKLVHIGTGLLTMLFPIVFTHYVWVIVICAAFLGLLILSLKYNLLLSINNIKRNSYGSVSYPIVVIITFLFYYFRKTNLTTDYYLFYFPILTMALADPAAALVGKLYPFGTFSLGREQKTVSGSLAFFLITLLLSFFLLPTKTTVILMLFSIVATVVEACSGKGLDNLTIPIAIILLLHFVYLPCV